MTITTLTVNQLRRAIAKIREPQVRPDIDGNINIRVYADGRPAEPFDERDSWLGGMKPVG